MAQTIRDAASVLGQEMSNILIGQLLIVMVKRAGGKIVLPIMEVDDTGQDVLDLSANHHDRTFTLTVSKKF